jgi:sodium/potassium/calcium exchanger 6
VADEHLSPSLQQLSKTFKFSESLAGVTLLAFGAGAPDVFASLSASEEADVEGIQLGISVLLGSSLFILVVISALVVYTSSEPIKLNKWFFIRDIAFLLMALGLLLFATKYRFVIDTLTSVAFISLYGAFVLVVVIQDTIFKKSRSLPE